MSQKSKLTKGATKLGNKERRVPATAVVKNSEGPGLGVCCRSGESSIGLQMARSKRSKKEGADQQEALATKAQVETEFFLG